MPTNVSAFNWGSYVAETMGEISGGLYPVFRRGEKLFIIKRANVEFPNQTWSKPWFNIHVTSVGYLNVNPINLEIEVPSLFSKDGIACCCILRVEVKIKTDIVSMQEAVMREDSVFASFQSYALSACNEVFNNIIYDDLYLRRQATGEALLERIGQAISTATPYELKNLVIDSVAAIPEGVDEAIKTANAARIQGENQAVVSKLREDAEREERMRERVAEQEDEIHRQRIQLEKIDAELNIVRKKNDSELVRHKATEEQRLHLRKIEQEVDLDLARQKNSARVERAGAIVDRIGRDAQIWIALNEPGLYAKMQMANAESNREVAIALQQLMQAHAHDKGVTETLKDVMNQFRVGLSENRIQILQEEIKEDDGKDKVDRSN